jgi:uncharacterized protein YozE (UPF0346 family)
MQFYTWMIKNYLNESSPKGDLANDMKGDDSFPRNTYPGKYNGWHNLIRGYLERNNACTDCLETFEECWEEYVNERKPYRTKAGESSEKHGRHRAEIRKFKL